MRFSGSDQYVAITLERPLLIKGEPGTGKTMLAEEIAAALRTSDKKATIRPLHGALLKNEQDVHLFERLIFMSRHNR